MQWGNKDSAELGVLVAQYESLRKESLNSINNRVKILLLGLAAIGAIVGGTLTIDHPVEKKFLIYVIFSGVIPLVTSKVIRPNVSDPDSLRLFSSCRVIWFICG